MQVLFVQNPRARRYLLRLRRDGVARVTIPRGGSMRTAQMFVERHTAWLERQWQRIATEPVEPVAWHLGTHILFRGQHVRLEEGAVPGIVQFGTERIRVADASLDLRPKVEAYLRRLANRELPVRVIEWAAVYQLSFRKVTVRNQRSRWGSCSRRGTISLNWRLIQTPESVLDYIILHELMHLREMNHSKRFWREVESVCPDYPAAERWLKQNAKLLR